MFINTKTGCVAVGTIGQNAEYSKVGDKKTPTIKFSIAVDKDEENKTVWINCQAWAKLADLWQGKITKGDLITVYGKVQTREYNEKTYKTLIAENIQKSNFSSIPKENLKQPMQENDKKNQNSFVIEDDDENELPF